MSSTFCQRGEFVQGWEDPVPCSASGKVCIVTTRPDGRALVPVMDIDGTEKEAVVSVPPSEGKRVDLVFVEEDRRTGLASLEVRGNAAGGADGSARAEMNLRLAVDSQGLVSLALLGRDSQVRERHRAHVALLGLGDGALRLLEAGQLKRVVS